MKIETLAWWRTWAEKTAISAALTATGGNRAAAARLLDVSRPTLYRLMEKHGL